MERPWENEPDVVEFEAHGLLCKVLRHPSLKHLCGYVGVGPAHPLYGLEYGQESDALAARLEEMKNRPADTVEMTFPRCLDLLSGGIKCSPDRVLDVHGGITFSGPGLRGFEHPDTHWFGFDCAHLGDWSPSSESFEKQHGYSRDGEYRDVTYVRSEAERLAKQLAEIGATPTPTSPKTPEPTPF